MVGHARIAEALRSGRAREAGRAALALARAGCWDDVVASAIDLHAPARAPERAAARAWLDAAAAAACVDDDPGDEEAWIALLDALIDAGRVDDALRGMALAREAGRLTRGMLEAAGRALLGQLGATAPAAGR